MREARVAPSPAAKRSKRTHEDNLDVAGFGQADAYAATRPLMTRQVNEKIATDIR